LQQDKWLGHLSRQHPQPSELASSDGSLDRNVLAQGASKIEGKEGCGRGGSEIEANFWEGEKCVEWRGGYAGGRSWECREVTI
jgi:hypothetical protein